MAFVELLDEDDVGDRREVDLLYVNTSWQERELIKLVPGLNWSDRRRAWVGPASWAACQALRGVFGDRLIVGARVNDWVWRERTRRVDPALRLRDVVDRAGLLPEDGRLRPLDLRERLREFQEVGALFGLTAGDFLLCDEMGTGKTVTTMALLAELGAEALPALVICPNSVKSVWVRHVREWLPGANPHRVGGGVATRRKTLAAARADPSAVVIVNIEAVRLLSRLAPYGSVALARCRECDARHGDPELPSTRCEVHPKELNGFGFRTVVLDEAHRIKNPESKQTRACWSVMHDRSVDRRIGLTGTPIANHVGDLWPIMHGLCRREFPTKGRFVDRYALMAWNDRGGLDIVGVNPAVKDEFYRVIDPRLRRVTKDRVRLQLPEKVYSTRYVTLTPKQLRAYREIERGNVTVLEDGRLLVAPNNLVARTRLIQFASSYAEVVPDPTPEDPDRTRVRLSEPSPKIDALLELVDDLGGKRFVACAESRQLIKLAHDRLTAAGVRSALLVGGMTDDERAAVVRRLRDGHVRAVLFTSQAGGTGVDGLQCVDTLIRLQRSWSMITNVQTDDRVHRIGSEVHDVVNIIDVVAEDTVEETVQLPRLEIKMARLREITRDRVTGARDPRELDDEYARILASDLGAAA